MKCSNHPDVDAAGMCAYSGKPFCSDDLVEVQGKMYAKSNLNYVMAELKEKYATNHNPTIFMNAGGGGGGSSSAANSVVAQPNLQAHPIGTKSRGVAVALAWLLGGLGAHKFYLGSPVWGILYLLFCWTAVPSIIAFFEGLNYLFMGSDNFTRRYG